MRLFKRKPKAGPLTVEDAIAQGVIDPAALQQHYIPKHGVSVKTYTERKDMFGNVLREPDCQTYYVDWTTWRNHLRSLYLGGPGTLATRDIPTGFREPVIDLGPGVTDLEYNAALGFLVDQGIANRKGQ